MAALTVFSSRTDKSFSGALKKIGEMIGNVSSAPFCSGA
jgi:hypothetical protein